MISSFGLVVAASAIHDAVLYSIYALSAVLMTVPFLMAGAMLSNELRHVDPRRRRTAYVAGRSRRVDGRRRARHRAHAMNGAGNIDATSGRHARVPVLGHLLPPYRTDYVDIQPVSAVVLLVAVVLALLWTNLFGDSYHEFWSRTLTIGSGDLAITNTLNGWINEGLMAVFFFVVALEMKREIVDGELKTRRRAAVPLVGAVGGMVVPALIFLAFNAGTPQASGWAVPMATDTAFAVGLLALFGSRVPRNVKVLLTSLAVVDDLGAIAAIALFYGHAIDAIWIPVALATVGLALALRALGVTRPILFVPVALLLWIDVFEAGFHATVAGVVLGFLVPARTPRRTGAAAPAREPAPALGPPAGDPALRARERRREAHPALVRRPRKRGRGGHPRRSRRRQARRGHRRRVGSVGRARRGAPDRCPARRRRGHRDDRGRRLHRLAVHRRTRVHRARARSRQGGDPRRVGDQRAARLRDGRGPPPARPLERSALRPAATGLADRQRWVTATIPPAIQTIAPTRHAQSPTPADAVASTVPCKSP